MSSKKVPSSTAAFELYTCMKGSTAQNKPQAMEKPAVPASHERVFTRLLGTISEDCIDKFHPSWCFSFYLQETFCLYLNLDLHP